jgi:competence protein ComEC
LGAFVLTLQKSQHAELMQQFDGKLINIIARVTDKQILPASERRDWKEIIKINVKRVSIIEQAANNYQKANFNLQCYSLANTNTEVDDIIEIKNVKIKVPKDQSLSQNTSYKNYLIKEDLLSSLFFYKSRCIKILYTPKLSINRWLWNIKNNTYQRLKQKISPIVFTYFSLMFLGNTQHKNIDSMRHTFSYWGLSHYLARSGLHIVLFILIWTFLLRLIPISIRFKRSLLILICLIYKLFSWTSLPFTRAFYAFILTEIGKIFNFQTDFLHLLSIVCLTILLFNPMQLFFLDFQLTFALTFALAFVSNYMH